MNALSWIIIAALIIFIVYRIILTRGFRILGHTKPHVTIVKTTNTTFNDVAGADEAKEELQEIVDFLKSPQQYTSLGGRIPKGILLSGPPGVGKTHLARATAGEAGVAFISASGSGFVEMFAGVGAARMRKLFTIAKSKAPCIIFIDELDAVGRKRGSSSLSHEEREQTLNELLVSIDGFEPSIGIVVIAATNREDILDSALLRPGRFDRKVYIHLPDVTGREGILKVHTSTIPLAEDVDLKRLAQLTTGSSGADLANMVNEATLHAGKFRRDRVTTEDFEIAREKMITGGKENKSLSTIMSAEDKRITAYHEAGHAIVAHVLPGADPLYKISIIPRGHTLGATIQIPDKDRYNVSESYLKELLAILYGGRIAEEIALHARTAGAQNDIERATDIARQMVCELGMFGQIKLCPRNYMPKSDFADRIYSPSPDTQTNVDHAIDCIIQEALTTARTILEHYRKDLDKLAKALLEKEKLTREEIEKILEES